MAQPFRIVFILYPRLTQLDFTGPYEVLARVPGVETVIASKDGGALKTEMGLTFADLIKLADVDRADMIMIPGGPGQTDAMLDPDFMAEVKRLGESAKYLTSVCTGSLILAAAGLLAGKRAGSHWAYRELLSNFGAVPDDARVVRDGNVITGGGVTAGIDIALTIAAELAGDDVAKMIQLAIEYAPAPPFNSGRPEIAEEKTVAAVKQLFSGFAQQRREAIERMVGGA
ncbi:DJ-1/PfpI family protein [Candidatus Viadribacter manganicus]|uniref:Thiamine biosynthesis protein ThiJ n=1 Tax=Candidatus Viadribacter manganicus TaxID=1759059 RepID=A0A1B1AEP3_9PROT|nr:DJ-1/PfpI family protein [Candidatus Viadribacter manganicus]ANP45033.1 thiamine biosynthesis protein ThiJ [Candidatus Viadribacter manganicus]